MASTTTDRRTTTTGLNSIPGMERAQWYFLRVSGILLVVLAGIHLFVTHYLTVPSETVFAFVADRWANPLWRTFDLLLLFSGLWHGLIGMRMIVTDMLRNKASRQIAYAIIWTLGIIFSALGTITIFTFNEEEAYNNTGPLADQMWIGDLIGYSLFAFAAVIYVVVILFIIWVIRNLQNDTVPVYNGDLGQYAWILHRVTGAGITFFLLVHIIDIMLVGVGRDLYDHTVAFYGNWFIVPMEIFLVGAVIYHMLNGLRVCAINFTAQGPVRQKTAFWWVLIATIVLTIPSGIVILMAHM